MELKLSIFRKHVRQSTIQFHFYKTTIFIFSLLSSGWVFVKRFPSLDSICVENCEQVKKLGKKITKTYQNNKNHDFHNFPHVSSVCMMCVTNLNHCIMLSNWCNWTRCAAAVLLLLWLSLCCDPLLTTQLSLILPSNTPNSTNMRAVCHVLEQIQMIVLPCLKQYNHWCCYYQPPTHQQQKIIIIIQSSKSSRSTVSFDTYTI